MGISSDQEREFYDRKYAQFLNVPDADLVCNRQVLEGDLENPAQPAYERRRLYRAVLNALTSEPVAGLSVLDYGCGTGDWGMMMASEGARVTFLDLSPAAIQVVLRRATSGGVQDRVRGFARDASDMTCFADEEFDLIFASSAVHHTLKYENATTELLRVLRRGGRLILSETYGNNKPLNMARRLGWKLSRQPDEAGEDIILRDQEIEALARHLQEVQVMPVNLFAMIKRVFRGHFTNIWVRRTVAAMESLDDFLLKMFPSLRRYCGEVVIVCRK